MKSTLPTVVVVGRPNVGKSTFFNRVVGKRVAVVQDEPGITRDRLYAETSWNGKAFRIVDTGGIAFTDEDPLSEQVRFQALIAIEEANVIVFLADGESGPTSADWELANALRNNPKPILLVANKTDNYQREANIGEFYELGIDAEVFGVSSLHGRGIADLLDRIVELLPDEGEATDTEEEVKVAIIGRPNVGKSSLINAFTGEQRMIVSSIAGTTRDAIDTELTYKDEKFRLIDTAGIRRKGKIQGSVEYYMVDRATRAIERSACAVIVVDGQEGLTDGDKRIAKIAHDSGKALVWVINKWDIVEPPNGHPTKMSPMKKDFIRILSDQVPELAYATYAFTSAVKSAGLEPVLDKVLESVESYSFRISTGKLNRIVSEAVYAKPLHQKGRQLKVYYATQVSTQPPTFSLFCNDPNLFHFSYQRYILNRIREAYPMKGTPIRLQIKASHKPKED